eukprot:scaffold434_cov358-Prasinococcus_capsulatus_cf.AAC.32
MAVQVLGQLTSTGTLQNDTAEKLRTFLATAATAASELEVSDSTRAEAQQMQQELLVKGNQVRPQCRCWPLSRSKGRHGAAASMKLSHRCPRPQVVDTLREDEELMDLVSTLSDTFAQKGLKGLDGSVKMSQGQNAYNELQATDLDQDPHALAGCAKPHPQLRATRAARCDVAWLSRGRLAYVLQGSDGTAGGARPHGVGVGAAAAGAGAAAGTGVFAHLPAAQEGGA